MARAPSENRLKAFEIYKEYSGKITSKKIAEELNESISNINLWRRSDRWESKLKGGAPKGNKNAVGHGAPEGNQNSRIHGLYSKLLPKQALNIFNEIDNMNPLDILWDSIRLKYTALLKSQKIMNVKNHNDITKELKRESLSPGKWGDSEEKEYEVQFAWDKQERFLKAQAKAMDTLTKMIKQYDEMLHKNWDLATEEQKARIEVLKSRIIDDSDEETEDDGFLEALEGKVNEVWQD